jgi:hypothetical protein
MAITRLPARETKSGSDGAAPTASSIEHKILLKHFIRIEKMNNEDRQTLIELVTPQLAALEPGDCVECAQLFPAGSDKLLSEIIPYIDGFKIYPNYVPRRESHFLISPHLWEGLPEDQLDRIRACICNYFGVNYWVSDEEFERSVQPKFDSDDWADAFE